MLLTGPAHLPAISALPGLTDYKSLLDAETSDYEWPVFDEPDAVEFVTRLPHTATGKLLKTQLRKNFAGHELKAQA